MAWNDNRKTVSIIVRVDKEGYADAFRLISLENGINIKNYMKFCCRRDVIRALSEKYYSTELQSEFNVGFSLGKEERETFKKDLDEYIPKCKMSTYLRFCLTGKYVSSICKLYIKTKRVKTSA